MNDEVILRKQAVDLFLKGSSKTDISIQIGRSRQWVHKWIKRYLDSGTSSWFVSQSNSPSKVVSKTPKDVEQLIIEIRKTLGEKKYSQKGAISIVYELNRLGVTAPSITTINRILKRNSLVEESDRQLVKKRIIQTISHWFNKWILLDQNTSLVVFGFTLWTS